MAVGGGEAKKGHNIVFISVRTEKVLRSWVPPTLPNRTMIKRKKVSSVWTLREWMKFSVDGERERLPTPGFVIHYPIYGKKKKKRAA